MPSRRWQRDVAERVLVRKMYSPRTTYEWCQPHLLKAVKETDQQRIRVLMDEEQKKGPGWCEKRVRWGVLRLLSGVLDWLVELNGSLSREFAFSASLLLVVERLFPFLSRKLATHLALGGANPRGES